jgi:hypothetical protein
MSKAVMSRADHVANLGLYAVGAVLFGLTLTYSLTGHDLPPELASNDLRLTCLTVLLVSSYQVVRSGRVLLCAEG